MLNVQNIFFIVLTLGAVQGLFLSLLLFQKRNNRRPNRFLSLLMLFYSLFIIGSVLSAQNFFLEHPYYFGILGGLPFLFGPLHYLYAKFLVSPELKFNKICWLHFLPFLIYRIYYLGYYFLSREEMITFIKNLKVENRPLIENIFTYGVITQGLVYMVITLRLWANHSKRIKECFSAIEKIDLIWLRNITILTLSVWMVVLIVHTTIRITGETLFIHHDQIISAATSILIYTMGYLGLKQVVIFSSTNLIDQVPVSLLNNEIKGKRKTRTPNDLSPQSDNVDQVKYEKSGLSEQKAKEHLSELINLMEKEKPFINSNLTLQDLSQKLSISTHNLSEIINSQLKKSFFDFINKYRVDEVKKALADPQKKNYTLLAIALDSGFNSKSSFNSIFKKHTNMTPSEYKNVVYKQKT